MASLDDVDLLDHDLFAAREPWDVFERLRHDAPVYWHDEPGGRGFWNVTRYDDVVAVLKDTETFSSELGGVAQIEDMREGRAGGAPQLHGDGSAAGTRSGGVSSRATSRPARSSSTSRSCASSRGGLLDDVAPARRVRLRRADRLAHPDPRARPPAGRARAAPRSPRRARGTRCSSTRSPSWHAWSGARPSITTTASSRSEARRPRSSARSAAASTPTGARIRSEDILSLVAHAEIGGCPLDERALDNTFALMVVAGNETTRQAMALGMLALMQFPDQLELLRSGAVDWRCAVDELIRYASPVWYFRRTATRDVGARGHDDPRGRQGGRLARLGESRSCPLPGPRQARPDAAAGRARRVRPGWPPFCLGAHLARLELADLFQELLPRIAAIELRGARRSPALELRQRRQADAGARACRPREPLRNWSAVPSCEAICACIAFRFESAVSIAVNCAFS